MSPKILTKDVSFFLRGRIASYLAVSITFMLATHSVVTAKDLPDEKQQVEIASLYLDLMKDMPKEATLINSPYPQAISVYGGAKAKIDNKSIIKGGRALRVKSGKPKRHAYSKGAKSATINTISPNDTLCLVYWARSINPPEENLTAGFARVGVQQSKDPYEEVFSNSHDLSYEWAAYAQKGKAKKEFDAGEAEVFFHFGHLKQRFEIGPIYLFNLGANVDEGFESNACGKTP